MALVSDGTITAVASRSLERAAAFADRFGVPTRYDRYEALCEDPDVDIVYVATPHSRHAADAELFLRAGKHVLCEKPFALNAGQARRMVEGAEASGVFLMEAMWTRFLPAYRVLRDLLAEGRIGEPRLVEADFGFRVPVAAEHRLFAPELGGGALLDLGVYPVQLCSLVLGTPDRVVADGAVGETGVDEQLAAVLHHPGGGLGVVKAAIRTALSCRARISGTDGWVELPVPMHCPSALRIGTVAGVEKLEAPFEGEGIRFQVEHVHRCLTDGRRESSVMPLAETVQIMTTLDALRAQLGVVYPVEPPSVLVR
jgi:predicted dehydrogenase